MPPWVLNVLHPSAQTVTVSIKVGQSHSSNLGRAFDSCTCRSTTHLGQSKKKRRRDRVSCAKVELPHNNLAKGDHISHEQEYNTGHGIPAISHEVRRKIRRQPRQSEIQQEPVVHLLLEAALGWKCGIPCLSVQAASQPSKPAYGRQPSRGSERFYSCHTFYSLDDFAKQLAVHNHRSNNLPIRPLHWLSPNEFTVQFV